MEGHVAGLRDTKTKEAARDNRCSNCGHLLELLDAAALREASRTELLDEALGVAEELEGQIQALPLGSEIEFDDAVISVLSKKIVRLRSLIERAHTPEEKQ